MIIPDTRTKWVPPKQNEPEMWPGMSNIHGWLPVHISVETQVVRWLDARNLRLAEPFFAATASSLRRNGEYPTLECETELSAVERAAGGRSVIPSGIIIHVTRCGSTLLTNALRGAERAVVLSEIPIFARLFDWIGSPSQYWAGVGNNLVRPLTAVFSHYQGNTAPRPVVVKCGTEGLVLMRAIRMALPATPCLVLIRDPVEVLVSIAAITPAFFLESYNSPDIWRLVPPPPEVVAGGHIEFWAWIIGRFCTDAIGLLDAGCRVLDYSQITPDVLKEIAEFFNLSFSEEGERAVNEAFRLDAKHPTSLFESDVADKRSRASEAIRASCARWADGPYRELRSRATTWNDPR